MKVGDRVRVREISPDGTLSGLVNRFTHWVHRRSVGTIEATSGLNVDGGPVYWVVHLDDIDDRRQLLERGLELLGEGP